MTGLTSLPRELMQEIISDLPHSALVSLAKTCKSLHFHVQPTLYKSIDWEFSDELTDELDNAPIHVFFRTLWEYPHLAAHVRFVHFRGNEERQYYQKLIAVPPSADEVGIWLKGIEELDMSNLELHRNLEHDLRAGNLDALATVLVSRLHNLEILRLDLGVISHFGYLAWLFQHAAQCEPSSSATSTPVYRGSRFQKLKKIIFRNDLDCNLFRRLDPTEQTVASLRYLPSLEFIETVLVERRDDPLLKLEVDSNSSNRSLPNVRELRLLNCGASTSTVEWMLSCMPNLRSLEYFYAQNMEALKYDYRNYKLVYRDEWQHFRDTLQVVSSTLTDLTISVDWFHIDDYPPENMDEAWIDGVWERKGSMGSLKLLTRLERLEVPLIALLGWTPGRRPNNSKLNDVLPRSLRELCLRDDLVGGPGYQWTLDRFQKGCDPSPVLNLLRAYLSPCFTPASAAAPTPGSDHGPLLLEALCLKMQPRRHWPPAALSRLSRICWDADVKCTVRERQAWDSDSVREVTLCDRSGTLGEVSWEAAITEFKHRLIQEPSRIFESNA